MGSNILVKIKYKLFEKETWQTLILSTKEYFDLEEGEQIEVNSVPFFNHAIDYIKQDKEKIEITKIIIEEKDSNKQLIISEVFWNDQNNRIIERTYSNTNIIEQLLITETQIQQNPLVYEIIRATRKDGVLFPEYHGFITEQKDGSQTENRLI